MPTFEVDVKGATYEVDAPDERTAWAWANKTHQQSTAQTPRPTAKEAPPEPFGQRLNREIAAVPRQLGLTARHAVQGTIGNLGDVVGAPIAAIGNMAGVPLRTPSQITSDLLDKAGLPKPETKLERVVQVPSEFLAGTGGMVGLAKQGVKAAANQNVQNVVRQLAVKPGLQASSAVGGGLAGGYTKETGGNAGAQFLATLGGGILSPMGVQGFSTAKNAVMQRLGQTAQAPSVTVVINNALKDSGYKVSDIPANVMKQMERDIGEAMKTGELSGPALKRYLDYKLVGATPARGNLTLDPVDITRQQNLAKIGANSTNPALNELALRQNRNTGKLIENLNTLGADTADDAYAGGQRVISALKGRESFAKSQIDAAYSAARDKQGRSVPLDRYAFSQTVNNLLDDAMVGGNLPGDVRNTINAIATGKKSVGMHKTVDMPFTVEVAEQLKTQVGKLQRATTDGQTRIALGLVRQALDETPIMQSRQVNPGNLPAVPGTVPPGNLEVGQDAIDAFNRARGLNREWMKQVEATPALQAVVDGVEPDKFVQQFIIGSGSKSSVMDVAKLKTQISKSPEAMTAVKQQIVSHLKNSATSGKPDEAMQFSSSAYNKALNAIGDRKLGLFFTKDEIAQLKSVGRVAMYEQQQVSGSAVNNSNTAGSMLANIFERIANSQIANKIPFGNAMITQPSQEISGALAARNVMRTPNALVLPKQKPLPVFPAPLLLAPGLLAE